jgi:hypothetical protein
MPASCFLQEYPMRFPSRLSGLISIARHARPRRSPAFRLERLENRDLLAAVAGVSLTYGNLEIQAPKPGGNTAAVAIDPVNHNIKVTLNGLSEEFTSSQVYNITYVGGASGGDTFVDNTSLVSLDYGYGGNNNFTGGSGYNYVFFYGNNNTFNGAAGVYSDVFEDGGASDSVVQNAANNNVAMYS